MEKEERLSRMEMRRKEWETGYICKDIVEDILKVIIIKEADEQELEDKRITHEGDQGVWPGGHHHHGDGEEEELCQCHWE